MMNEKNRMIVYKNPREKYNNDDDDEDENLCVGKGIIIIVVHIKKIITMHYHLTSDVSVLCVILYSFFSLFRFSPRKNKYELRT